MSVFLPSYLYCLVSSSTPVIYSYTVVQLYNFTVIQSRTNIHTSYIHTLIQSYINTFTYSYIRAYTTYTQHQFIHGCISHPEFCVAGPLEFGPHSSLCSSDKFQQTNNLNPFKSIIPNVSGQDMPLINLSKWQVPTNEQLEPFQKCHPQCVWSRDITNQSFRAASSNKRTT